MQTRESPLETMGSLETPVNEEKNGTTTASATGAADSSDRKPPSSSNGSAPPSAEAAPSLAPAEPDVAKKRKTSMLPLEVGTCVACRWRDGKYHPVKVIERRKMPVGGLNDYEYYVHYTECESSPISVSFCCRFWVRVRIGI